jgi:tRNA(fMet)-specific endonuclease VapC
MIVEFRTMESTKVSHPIGQDDLQVTVIALANNLTLFPHNTREFKRVQGLQFEDWEVVI